MADLDINVYFQNNDQMKLMEGLLEGAREQEAMWRERCKVAESRLADAQHVNLELIDTMKLHGYKFRRTSDMRTWK